MTDVTVRSRGDIGDERWDAYVQQHPDGWFWHTSHFIKYALYYTPESRDASVALVRDDTGDVLALTAGLSPTQAYGGQERPTVLHTLGMTWDVAALGPGVRMQSRPTRYGISPPPDANIRAHEVGTFVVDLSRSEDDHLRRVRKSYRHLIRRAQDAYWLSVFDTGHAADLEALMAARLLHTTAAGRETRSRQTWLEMFEWMRLGFGVLVLAYLRSTDEPVGFAYAVRYKHWAYWCSGASLVPDLQAAIQWRMMTMLRHCPQQVQTRYYEIGRDAAPGDDDKAKAIAFFKSGLGGERWVVQILEAA